jgi:predicted enzyme related to lactoylglutathione lyase
MIESRKGRERRPDLPSFVAGCLFAFVACAAEAAPFDLPAINDPASNQHHMGQVIWRDLRTTDLDGAKKFYAALFGWDFRDYQADGTEYAVAMSGGRPVAGLVGRPVIEGEQRRSAWLPFISAHDVDATVRNGLSHRAHILEDAQNRPLRGRQALLSDPDGTSFVIEASSSGDPPDAPPTPGNWCGTSLYARDPGDAAVFYQQLFGYALEGLPANGGFERERLSSGGRLRIRVHASSDAAPELAKRWINFVCVANLAEATARALKLGGRVLFKSQRDTPGVDTPGVATPGVATPGGPSPGVAAVIIADPTGAPFGMTQLPP